jgi:cell division protein FtsZ
MSIKIGLPPAGRPQPSIAVLGVGGGGGNAVRSMIEGDVKGVQFMAANTDVQALEESKAELKIHLGTELTRGYGAGTDPKIGRRAAEESLHEIRDALEGLDMLFITAGMGGGTGTGASPVIARVARELGILTVGVMTSPFRFEGEARMEVARRGIKDTLEQADTLLLISNQNIFQLENGVPHLLLAFESVNGILRDAIRGVVDLVTRPGMINTDFADLVMALRDGGLGVIGEGVASGPDRSRQAAIQAATNPLLDGVTLEGAGRLLINVTGGRDLSPDDFDEAVNYLRNLARPDAQMKVGASFDPEMEGSVRVYIAASGVEQLDSVESSRTSLRVAAEEEHSGVREIRVSEQPKELQTRPTAESERSSAQPSIPPVVELSAGLWRPASPAVASAARETPLEPLRRDTGGDDDWDDGIEIDIRSQSSSRTVAVSPTLSGGLQDPPVRAEKEFQPRFRQGYRRPASGLGTGPSTTDRFGNPGAPGASGAPVASGASGQRIPSRGLPTRPVSGGVSFSGSTGPRADVVRSGVQRPAVRKPVGVRNPPAGDAEGNPNASRRDFGIRAGVPNLPRPDPTEDERKVRAEVEKPVRGVARRSPGLLARLLSLKE